MPVTGPTNQTSEAIVRDTPRVVRNGVSSTNCNANENDVPKAVDGAIRIRINRTVSDSLLFRRNSSSHNGVNVIYDRFTGSLCTNSKLYVSFALYIF